MEERAGLQFGREAYVYLYPMVKNYLSIYQFMIDRKISQYEGVSNRIGKARASTPDDTAFTTSCSDTPYSLLVMDLRAEPIVVTTPPIDEGRNCYLQIVDLYTDNVDCLGTPVDGNEAGSFLIAGPGWIGEVLAGITRIVRVATELACGQIRTQLFGPECIDEVKKVQPGYTVRPLSAFLKQKAASAPAVINWPTISEESFDIGFWQYANFLLPFCPPLPAEAALRTRFKAVGLGEAPHWPPTGLDPAFAQQIVEGGADGRKDIQALLSKAASPGLLETSDGMSGTYLARAARAMGGIYGKPLDSGQHNYRSRFPPGELPAGYLERAPHYTRR